MSLGVVIILVVWVMVMVLIVKSVVVVPADFAYVVKSMGRVSSVLEPGLHLIVPIVSRVAARILMLEQVLDVPAASGAMQEGTPASVRGSIRFRVTDPARAIADVANFRDALIKLAASQWTQTLAESDRASVLDALGASESTIRTAAAAWGIEVLNASPLLILDDDAGSLLGNRDTLGTPPLPP